MIRPTSPISPIDQETDDQSAGHQGQGEHGGDQSEDAARVAAEGDEGGDEMRMDNGGEAQVNLRVARDPGQPTARDRELHNVTHIPPRSWCDACMQGRGKDRYHKRRGDSEEVPRVGMDYAFITERGVTHKRDEAEAAASASGGQCVTVLVMKDFLNKSVWAYPVEGKGTEKADWLTEQIREDLATIGMDNCVLVIKTDQEPAIKEVQEELAERRRATGARGTVTEHSRVGDSSSNGRTERSIQELGGLVRTLRLALQTKIGGDPIGLEHAIVPWLIKHAGQQITRYQIRAC